MVNTWTSFQNNRIKKKGNHAKKEKLFINVQVAAILNMIRSIFCHGEVSEQSNKKNRQTDGRMDMRGNKTGCKINKT